MVPLTFEGEESQFRIPVCLERARVVSRYFHSYIDYLYASLSLPQDAPISAEIENTIASTPIPLTISFEHTQEAIHYINHPTHQTYGTLSDEAVDFYGLQIPGRDWWLEEDFQSIRAFKQKHGVCCVVDTTPNIGEQIDNLLQFCLSFGFKSVYREESPQEGGWPVDLDAILQQRFSHLGIAYGSEDSELRLRYWSQFIVMNTEKPGICDVMVFDDHPYDCYIIGPVVLDPDDVYDRRIGSVSLSLYDAPFEGIPPEPSNRPQIVYGHATGQLTPELRYALSDINKILDWRLANVLPVLNSLNEWPSFRFNRLSIDIDSLLDRDNGAAIVAGWIRNILEQGKIPITLGNLEDFDLEAFSDWKIIEASSMNPKPFGIGDVWFIVPNHWNHSTLPDDAVLVDIAGLFVDLKWFQTYNRLNPLEIPYDVLTWLYPQESWPQ